MITCAVGLSFCMLLGALGVISASWLSPCHIPRRCSSLVRSGSHACVLDLGVAIHAVVSALLAWTAADWEGSQQGRNRIGVRLVRTWPHGGGGTDTHTFIWGSWVTGTLTPIVSSPCRCHRLPGSSSGSRGSAHPTGPLLPVRLSVVSSCVQRTPLQAGHRVLAVCHLCSCAVSAVVRGACSRAAVLSCPCRLSVDGCSRAGALAPAHWQLQACKRASTPGCENCSWWLVRTGPRGALDLPLQPLATSEGLCAHVARGPLATLQSSVALRATTAAASRATGLARLRPRTRLGRSRSPLPDWRGDTLSETDVSSASLGAEEGAPAAVTARRRSPSSRTGRSRSHRTGSAPTVRGRRLYSPSLSSSASPVLPRRARASPSQGNRHTRTVHLAGPEESSDAAQQGPLGTATAPLVSGLSSSGGDGTGERAATEVPAPHRAVLVGAAPAADGPRVSPQRPTPKARPRRPPAIGARPAGTLTRSEAAILRMESDLTRYLGVAMELHRDISRTMGDLLRVNTKMLAILSRAEAQGYGGEAVDASAAASSQQASTPASTSSQSSMPVC